MSSIKTIRAALDLNQSKGPLRDVYGQEPYLFRGNDLVLQLGIFEAGALKSATGGTVYAEVKTAANPDLVPALSISGSVSTITLANWKAGTAQHVTLTATGEATAAIPAGRQWLTIWWTLESKEVTLYAGPFDVREDGVEEAGTPDYTPDAFLRSSVAAATYNRQDAHDADIAGLAEDIATLIDPVPVELGYARAFSTATLAALDLSAVDGESNPLYPVGTKFLDTSVNCPVSVVAEGGTNKLRYEGLSFATVAAMEGFANGNVVDGQRFDWLGYYAVGDFEPVSGRFDASSVTANGVDIRECGVPGFRIFLNFAKVSVRHAGAKTGEGEENASAVELVTNWAAGRRKIHWPAGQYNIERPLVLTCISYCWVGERSEHSFVPGPEDIFPLRTATRITYTPVNTSQFMVSRYELVAGGTIGPFEHVDISFSFDAANGFQFGLEGPDIYPANGASTPQRFVYGVIFRRCNFTGPRHHSQDEFGRFVRLNRTFVSLANAYQVLFDGVSMRGGDVQVRAWMCDRPNFKAIRSFYSSVVLWFEARNGAGGVQHSVENIEVEGCVFSPIVSNGNALSVVNATFEDFGYTAGGTQDLTDLFGYTATIEEGGGEVTFSENMEDIIHVDLSIVKLRNSNGDVFHFVPSSVVEGVVTFDNSNNKIPWGGSGLNVERIHTYGPIHGGTRPASIVNVARAGMIPPFVWKAGRGDMMIANSGFELNRESLIIGNTPAETSYMSSCMSFVNCGASIWPDLSHPLANVIGVTNLSGSNARGTSASRASMGDGFEAFTRVRRIWAFNPKRSANSANAYSKVPTIAYEPPIVSQRTWCWVLTGGAQFELSDPSLPNVPGKQYRLTVRCRAKGDDPVSVSLLAVGGGTSTLGTIVADGTLRNHTLHMLLPTGWASEARGSRPGIWLTPSGVDNKVLLDSVVIEELSEENNDRLVGASGSQRTRSGRATGTTANPSTLIELDVDGKFPEAGMVAMKLHLVTSSNHTSYRDYAHHHSEWSVMIAKNSSGAVFAEAYKIWENAVSFNDSVFSINCVVTVSVISGVVSVVATPTHSGTQGPFFGASEMYWNALILDDKANNLYI